MNDVLGISRHEKKIYIYIYEKRVVDVMESCDAMACNLLQKVLLCLKVSAKLEMTTWWVGSNDGIEARGFA